MRAIITGASSGIGAALARELSRRGWSLALLARRQELLDQLVGELKTDAVALAADVTDRDAVKDGCLDRKRRFQAGLVRKSQARAEG